MGNVCGLSGGGILWLSCVIVLMMMWGGFVRVNILLWFLLVCSCI